MSDAPLEGAAVTGSAQYLTFVLGGKAFAVDIMRVKEIIEYGGVTPVPMMPAWVPGVINLRGTAVTIMDLSARRRPLRADSRPRARVRGGGRNNFRNVRTHVRT